MPKGAKHGGRVKGTPNKSTAAIRAVIEAADPIGFMGEVMNGRMPKLDQDGKREGIYEEANQTSRMQAAQFLAKRIAPEAKENPINFDIGLINGAGDAVEAIGKATAAVARGEIKPSEGKIICDMLGAFVRVYEVNQFAARLDALEAAISKGAR